MIAVTLPPVVPRDLQRPWAGGRGLAAIEFLGVWVNVRWENGFWDYFFIGLFIALSWTVGFVLSRRATQARELAERAERLEREQAEAAERAVADERQRIARELHDVIAHSVSVMTVQAGAVRRLLLPEQEKEREALETVEATGRDALTEMRRLVGLLREQGAMPEFSPQPGLGSMDALLETVRSRGSRSSCRRRRSAGASGGRRPGGLPRRPGGAHERSEARRDGARLGLAPLA